MSDGSIIIWQHTKLWQQYNEHRGKYSDLNELMRQRHGGHPIDEGAKEVIFGAQVNA